MWGSLTLNHKLCFFINFVKVLYRPFGLILANVLYAPERMCILSLFLHNIPCTLIIKLTHYFQRIYFPCHWSASSQFFVRNEMKASIMTVYLVVMFSFSSVNFLIELKGMFQVLGGVWRLCSSKFCT